VWYQSWVSVTWTNAHEELERASTSKLMGTGAPPRSIAPTLARDLRTRSTPNQQYVQSGTITCFRDHLIAMMMLGFARIVVLDACVQGSEVRCSMVMATSAVMACLFLLSFALRCTCLADGFCICPCQWGR